MAEAFPKVYTSAEVRELDRRAIEDHGIPGIVLMKRAGRATFDAIAARWPDAVSLCVVCGVGNNAGDGYVIAGLAREAGLAVRVLQVGDGGKLKGDAATARDWAAAQGVEAEPFAAAALTGDVVVDALLGTGAAGPMRPAFAEAVEAINACGRPVAAVDVPSGILADSGASLGAAVRADLTVTFIGVKLGLVTGAGVDHVGELGFDDLDCPAAVYREAGGIDVIDGRAVQAIVERPRSAHKNRFGHVLVVGGDLGMGGAVILAGEAALRTGAGLVSVVTRPQNQPAVLARRPELMVRGVEEGDAVQDLIDAATVIAVGPGLGRRPWGERLLHTVLRAGKPVVADADALNLLAEKGWKLPPGSVLTPHPGEAARLLGTDNAGIAADRPGAVVALSDTFAAAAVLKGAGSLVAHDGAVRGVCVRGNPGMATAGSGDVLTGIVAALMAQGCGSLDAAATGVWLHARAGDAAAADLGQQRMLATDLIARLYA